MSTADKPTWSEDTKRLSRQLARSACRLEKLLELGAPAAIVERERRMIAKRITAFPVATGEAARQADELEKAAA